MRKYNFLITILLIFCIVLIGACSPTQESEEGLPPEKKTEEQSEEMPSLLSIGAHPMGSSVFAMASGISSVLNNHLPIKFDVVSTTGPLEWVPMIISKELELGVLSSIDALYAFESKDPYTMIGNEDPIRLLTSGTPANIGFLATEDSDIRTGEDFKGKRVVGTFTNIIGSEVIAKAGFANLGLTENDFINISVPDPNSGIKALIEGRADATASASLGMAVVEELDATRGARFIGFDPSPEAVKRFQEIAPGVDIVKVEPAPGRPYLKEPAYVSDYPFYLVGSTELSDEIAYQIVKNLWENNAELTPIHAMLGQWVTEKFIHKKAVIPYHPGAVKFYKEVGVWDEEMEELQNTLLQKAESK